MPLTSYTALQAAFAADIRGAANSAHIGKIYRASLEFLAKAQREPLRSLIPNKEYFAFRVGTKLSRPVNTALFIERTGEWDKLDRLSSANLYPNLVRTRLPRSFTQSRWL